MSIGTLVIGLGGTGVLTVRSLKQLWEKLPEKERVPASFLAFDFDRSAVMAGDPEGRFAKLLDQEFFYLNPEKLQERLRNIDRGQNGGLAWQDLLKWFPDRAKVRIPTSEVEANGASQLRVLGRLGFFENDEVIERMIRVKLNELGTEVDPSRLSEDKRVVIVSSVAGGTGAGMLIDVAYVARRQLRRPRVYAYLLLPEVFQDVDSGGRIYQNAYACLRELAYLKDQQIPFDAEYERIPPIHVPVLGEEPFARIFLCSGDGFAGADSIKIATRQIADSILGQLQRTIQEKTLAIASNTLSADSHEEQSRRRTHCFSTVTSMTLPLRRVDLQETVFDKVVELLRSDAELQELYLDDLRQLLGKVANEMATDARRGKVPAPETKETDETKADDEVVPEAERILKEWNDLGSAAADRAAWKIVGEILSLLQMEEGELATAPHETFEARRRELGDLRTLIFGDLVQETPDFTRLIPFLRDSPAYREYEKELPRTLKLELLAPEAQLTTDKALKRRALYALLKKTERERLLVAPIAQSERFRELQQRLASQEKALAPRRIQWFQSRRPETDLVQSIRLQQDLLSQTLGEGSFTSNLQRILLARARQEIDGFLEDNRKKVSQQFEDAQKLWTEGKYQALESRQTLESLGSLHDEVIPWLKENLPKVLDESRALVKAESTAEEKRQVLSNLLARRIEREQTLQGEHYVLDEDAATAEDMIRERLVRARQRVFEKRTPNPQRKGIALVMVPQGLIWPSGDPKSLRRFLEASAAQILAVRSQVEDYEGSRIWIYYEDLFNPPEHVRNIDEYFRTYDSQEFQELFHIDRRFLENQAFKEINSQRTSIVVTCGNDDCRENISGVPRKERICPGCGKMIRNRCGNDNCTANDLTSHTDWASKSCPVCHGFNHAAWWCCTKHGKVAAEIPIDKDRCPTCIEEHQQDPVRFPYERISLRPDLVDSRSCLSCEEQRKTKPDHDVFRIRKDLLPFYLHGVNGHDKDTFMNKIAPKHHLPDNCRCPNCRALLIPVHHKSHKLSCERRPAQ